MNDTDREILENMYEYYYYYRLLEQAHYQEQIKEQEAEYYREQEVEYYRGVQEALEQERLKEQKQKENE